MYRQYCRSFDKKHDEFRKQFIRKVLQKFFDTAGADEFVGAVEECFADAAGAEGQAP